MNLRKPVLPEACHGNCHLAGSRSQVYTAGSTSAVSQLPRRDLPTLGRGGEKGARSTPERGVDVSLSLLSLRADVSVLPTRGGTSQSNGTDEGVGRNDRVARRSPTCRMVTNGANELL